MTEEIKKKITKAEQIKVTETGQAEDNGDSHRWSCNGRETTEKVEATVIAMM